MKNELKNAVFDIVKRAGEMILSAHSEKAGQALEVKAGNANFVTEYDVAVQKFIIEKIKELFPECEFVAEEKENDSSVLSARDCFVLDPIDGTTNFMRNLRQSSISLAHLSCGVLDFAIIYIPYSGEIFYAEKGKGAFLNGKEIHVSERSMNEGVVSIGTAPYYRELAEKTFDVGKEIFLSCADMRRFGSAAIEMAYLASGRIDMFFELRLSPWDFAAGKLILLEAGGVITNMEGEELSLCAPSSVMASNKKAYPKLKEITDRYK